MPRGYTTDDVARAYRERTIFEGGRDREAEEYRAWLDDIEENGRTPPLIEYMYWCQYDSNLPWRLGSGHLINLLDAALERIEELEDERGQDD